MRSKLCKALALAFCLALCLCFSSAAYAESGVYTLPADTTCIEAEAFSCCKNMTSVTIPVGVTYIGENAFYGCTKLRDVYYGGTPEQWDEIKINSGNGPLTRANIHFVIDADSYYITLTYSSVFTPQDWNGKAAEKFADMVGERTEGHVKVVFHGHNELDCYRDSVVHAVNGDNWIGLEEPSLFAEWVGDCAVLVGPMLYQNDAEYNFVMDSELVQGVKNALAAENIHILDTHYSSGYRSVCTNKNIYRPSDLYGVKLRSNSAPLFVKTIEAMGAQPVIMSFTDCLTGIQQGVIDGLEGLITTLAGSGAHSTVKNVALTRHFIAARWLFMAESVYQEMPQKWRSILEDCAVECGVWEQTNSASNDAALAALLTNEAGVTWNEVDIDAFTAACDPVYDWIVSEYEADPALHAKIVALVRSYRGSAPPAPPPGEPVTLVYAEVNPLEGTIVGAMAKAFKARVEAISGGQVRVDIQASGVLGSEDQILDNLLGGGNICDLCRTSAFALTQYGCNKASLLSIPYTFASENHFWNFANSELAQEFLSEPQEMGLPVRGLCYGSEGFRHFFFSRRVRGINDLQDLKIRVSSDPVMRGMVSDLGAVPVSIPFTELYSALNVGVVDGSEQPVSNYYSNAFHEVAPYVILDGHTLVALQIVISDKGWAKLNAQQQEWVREAAQYASAVCRDKLSEQELVVFQNLRNKGATIVEMTDKAPWRAACQPVIQANTGNLTEVYQQILAME